MGSSWVVEGPVGVGPSLLQNTLHDEAFVRGGRVITGAVGAFAGARALGCAGAAAVATYACVGAEASPVTWLLTVCAEGVFLRETHRSLKEDCALPGGVLPGSEIEERFRVAFVLELERYSAVDDEKLVGGVEEVPVGAAASASEPGQRDHGVEDEVVEVGPGDLLQVRDHHASRDRIVAGSLASVTPNAPSRGWARKRSKEARSWKATQAYEALALQRTFAMTDVCSSLVQPPIRRTFRAMRIGVWYRGSVTPWIVRM